tara:strand:- start:3873 stop:4811 length:939 start_codon:yes stop_codon:yes gene_type:complete
MLNKPKFWDKKKGLLAYIFLPLALIILIINLLKKKLIKTKKFNIPVICIGNIYIGGTGKTPTSIFVGNELKRLGRNPVILRKYYRDHKDEHILIKRNYNNFILAKDRVIGIKESQKKNFDSVILDDGFQDFTINKDLNILCFNQNQMIGNGMTIPSGPLRESLSSLQRAQIILINGEKNIEFEDKILKINKNLDIFYSDYYPINLNQFKNKKLLAIAGIGNPENFFRLIEKNNLKIHKKLIFPDHYLFSKIEIENIMNEAKSKGCQIIMTEKDYFKIEHFNFKNINYLKVLLKIEDREKFLNRINKIYDKKN